MKPRNVLAALLLFALMAVPVSAAPPTQGGGQEYVVQEDDWLSKIADRYYGDMMAYPVIVEATNARAKEDSSFATITNPDLIEVGQKLWIPDVPSKETAAPMAMPTLASLPGGGTVYADPQGRFTLPLVGDWTPVETDGSYARFTLADPSVELYVVAVESDDLEVGVDAALAQIGVDASALSLLVALPDPRWNIYLYSLGDGQGVTLAAWALDGATVTVIITGELSVTTAPPAQVMATMTGFAPLPLAEYLEYRPPPAPTTIEAIENLDYVEFYSGRSKLVGRLLLPEGEGPFPAVVFVHGSGTVTRSKDASHGKQLRDAGFAAFLYDKRGVGDSEGLFVPASTEISEWRLPLLADDALAAVAFLQGLEEINPDQIGLMGVSQAGWIIPLAASRSDAPAFAVIVAGATVSMGEEGYWSEELAGDVARLPPMTESEREELSEKLASFDGARGFDPRQSIEAMSIPGLWIWGDRDGSMPARECKAILESIIAEYDKDFAILYYPDAGHEWPSSWTSEAVDWIYAHLEE